MYNLFFLQDSQHCRGAPFSSLRLPSNTSLWLVDIWQQQENLYQPVRHKLHLTDERWRTTSARTARRMTAPRSSTLMLRVVPCVFTPGLRWLASHDSMTTDRLNDTLPTGLPVLTTTMTVRTTYAGHREPLYYFWQPPVSPGKTELRCAELDRTMPPAGWLGASPYNDAVCTRFLGVLAGETGHATTIGGHFSWAQNGLLSQRDTPFAWWPFFPCPSTAPLLHTRTPKPTYRSPTSLYYSYCSVLLFLAEQTPLHSIIHCLPSYNFWWRRDTAFVPHSIFISADNSLLHSRSIFTAQRIAHHCSRRLLVPWFVQRGMLRIRGVGRAGGTAHAPPVFLPT